MILTNGDSFTEGYYLGDASKSWPSVLASLTGEPNINLALGGSSNHRIFRTTMTHLYTNHSISKLIIGWTDVSRFEFPLQHGDYLRVFNSHASVEDKSCADQLTISENDLHKFYFKHLHNEFLNIQSLIVFILTLQDICKYRGIEFYNFMAFGENYFKDIKENNSKFTYLAHKHCFRKDDDVVAASGVDLAKTALSNLFDQIDFTTWITGLGETMQGKLVHYPMTTCGHPAEHGQEVWANIIKDVIEK